MIDFWYWKKAINSDKINQINDFIDNNFEGYEEENQSATYLDGTRKKNNIVKCIKWKEIKHFLENLEQSINIVNQENFGYHLYPFTGYEETLLNIYPADQQARYDWHSDESRSYSFDFKFTVLINVSKENYEGGDFELNIGGNPKKIEDFTDPGDILMFKSYMIHRVLPILSGERRTLALFVKGPKFR